MINETIDSKREKKKVWKSAWDAANIEKNKAYRVANKDKIKARYLAVCDTPEFKKERAEYRESNRERQKVLTIRWYLANKEKAKTSTHAYYLANKDTPEYKAKRAAHERKRTVENPEYKFATLLRGRLGDAIKNNSKRGSAVTLLGCTVEEARQHIEGQFQEGMSWDNWGLHGWHLDHIMPLISFDLENEAQLAKACHYSNLQPLWAKDNLSKGAKIAA